VVGRRDDPAAAGCDVAGDQKKVPPSFREFVWCGLKPGNPVGEYPHGTPRARLDRQKRASTETGGMPPRVGEF